MQVQRKSDLRRTMRQLRREAAPELIEKEAVAAIGRVVSDPAVAATAVVMLYCSLPDELPTDRIFRALWQMGKQTVVPVVDGVATMHLAECLPSDLEEPAAGAFGIREPQREAFMDYASVGVAIVPGMAFDRDGWRLGRGRGYYDRFLPLLPNATRIGLCHSFQLIGSVPHAAHDVRMHRIIVPTE